MKAGDRVMCVDVNWREPVNSIIRPKLGLIYTVRCGRLGRKGPSVLLVGVTNPICFGTGREYGFYALHFRKIDDIPDRVTVKQHRVAQV